MPAKWTADIIGKMHLHGVTRKQLAKELNLHEKYVIAVLNGKREPPNAEERFNAALDSIIAEKAVE